MVFQILSDVHGNKFGLEAVLSAGRDCGAVLCLGDVVDYGAHPNECCELLRERGAICLSGNHDAAVVGLIDPARFRPFAQVSIGWTREQLAPENLDWLKELPANYRDPDLGFQAVHASLRDPWEEYIIGKSVALPNIEKMTEPVCFYGHTHQSDFYACLNVPGKRFHLEHTPLPDGGIVEMREPWTYLVNPGSCGQPRDHNIRARYATFDTETRQIEVLAVEYDVEAARRAILEAGLPAALGDRLLSGQ
jgi:diadenosine tetraphosphatase ApaH/serine/threonine PP2A family protein phosphatase